MKRILYFRNEDSEYCHKKDYFLSEMNPGDTMTVFKAIPDKCKEYFWCGAVDEFCIQEEGSCGNDSDSYNPCNGKSGKCKFKTHLYKHGEKITIVSPSLA